MSFAMRCVMSVCAMLVVVFIFVPSARQRCRYLPRQSGLARVQNNVDLFEMSIDRSYSALHCFGSRHCRRLQLDK